MHQMHQMHFVHFRVLLAIAIYLTCFRQVDLEKLMRRKAKQWQKAAKQKELQDIDSDSGSESGDEVRTLEDVSERVWNTARARPGRVGTTAVTPDPRRVARALQVQLELRVVGAPVKATLPAKARASRRQRMRGMTLTRAGVGAAAVVGRGDRRPRWPSSG